MRLAAFLYTTSTISLKATTTSNYNNNFGLTTNTQAANREVQKFVIDPHEYTETSRHLFGNIGSETILSDSSQYSGSDIYSSNDDGSSSPNSSYDYTTSTGSSSYAVNISASYDLAAARLATIQALQYDIPENLKKYQLANQTLYNQYVTMNNYVSTITESGFYDNLVAYSIRDIMLQLYSNLPKSDQQELLPSISSYYGEFYGIAETDYEPVTPSLTTTWDTMVTGANGYYSDFYQIALGQALYKDLTAYGHYYNEWSTTTSNHTMFERMRLLQTWITSSESAPEMLQYLIELSFFTQHLPDDWRPRILANAKLEYYSSWATATGGQCIGADSCIPSSIVPKTAINTGQVTLTSGESRLFATYYPYIISYETVPIKSSSTGVPSPMAITTTLSHEVTITGPVTTSNKITTTATFKSDLGAAVSCAIYALGQNYYLNETQFDMFISSSNSSEYVQTYTSILKRYKTEDIFKRADSYNIVLTSFYNFIFKLPDEKKYNVLDALGYCYLLRFAAIPANEDGDYTVGSGSLFSSMFRFGDGSALYLDFSPVTLSNAVVHQAFETTIDPGIVYADEYEISSSSSGEASTTSSFLIFPTTVIVDGNTDVTGAPGLTNVVLYADNNVNGASFDHGLLKGLIRTG